MIVDWQTSQLSLYKFYATRVNNRLRCANLQNMERFKNKSILIILTMINTVRVSSRGQIVIPEEVRNHFGIKEGSKLILIQRDDSLIFEKEEIVTKKLSELEKAEIIKKLAEFKGSLKGMAKMSDEEAGELAFRKIASEHGIKLD